MKTVRVAGLLAWAWVWLQAGCGPAPGEWEEAGYATWPGEQEAPGPGGGLEVAPVREERPRPVPPMFQPGFHLALRWSHTEGSPTTFRLRVPVGRAGQRLRLAFRSGEGSLELRRATVARAGPDGSLASEPVPVTFSGARGFSVGQRTRVVSDALPFPVGFREELAVSFEVEGAMAASAINLLPGSFARSGTWATTSGRLGGTEWSRPVGLATVEVEGPPSRAFVTLGDSITEGYISDDNDLRDTWGSRTEAALGLPFVNAAVSGQGFYGALEHLDEEVLVLSGLTDCMVLLGTNDLSSSPQEVLRERLSRLLERLEPLCRTWVGTLPPKEQSSHGDHELTKVNRLEFNAWIRGTLPRVIDFEAVTRSPDEVHQFLGGLDVDGIHPSHEGHRVMAEEAVRVLRAHGVDEGP